MHANIGVIMGDNLPLQEVCDMYRISISKRLPRIEEIKGDKAMLWKANGWAELEESGLFSH